MPDNIKKLGLISSLQQLFPNSKVTIKNSSKIKGKLEVEHLPNTLQVKSKSEVVIKVDRDIDFSSFEQSVFSKLVETLELLENYNTPSDKLPKKVSNLIYNYLFISGFEDITIGRYLRKSYEKGFRTQLLTIKVLTDLAQQNYENHKCSSGFIYIHDINESLIDKLSPHFTYNKFDSVFELDFNFFNEPASHRYVDGKNTFYLLTKDWKVNGLLTLSNPSQFSYNDRSIGEQFNFLFKNCKSCWATYIGPNRDLKIHTESKCILHWDKFHWQVKDYTLIESYIQNKLNSDETSSALLKSIVALSDKRIGTLVLIAEDPKAKLDTSGNIDRTKLKEELQKQLKSKKITSLTKENRLINILSSDGLTTIDKNGEIINTGQIIELKIKEPNNNIETLSGGGRTQAAIIASQYGLVIKVSEDGPISIFEDGKMLFKM